MPEPLCDPNLELTGYFAYGIVSSLLVSEYSGLLERYGLNRIDPTEWYSLFRILEFLEEIGKRENASALLVSMGIAAAEYLPLPTHLVDASIVEFFRGYPDIYQQFHRNGDAGAIFTEIEGLNVIWITIPRQAPYPDDISYGFFYGGARRLLKNDESFVLEYVDTGRPRRAHGGDETRFRLTVYNTR